MNPKYPIYIVSKGRWEKRKTSRKLEEMNVPYKIVIEPQEYIHYSRVINPEKILVLPFSELGQGSVPARNWIWRHALESGVKRHWILDDNIFNFYRLNNNLTVPVSSGTIFRAAEDFVDRYENVPVSGFEYFMFIERKRKLTPYRLNTRVYSCLLIENSLPFRWFGRFNEDTDLSLKTLKAGYCTILFQAFLCDKTTTMKDKGGNSEDYNDIEDSRKFATQVLIDNHPDVVRMTQKWGRWHHHINYGIFKTNRLIKKKNLNIRKGINNYGMTLMQLPE